MEMIFVHFRACSIGAVCQYAMTHIPHASTSFSILSLYSWEKNFGWELRKPHLIHLLCAIIFCVRIANGHLLTSAFARPGRGLQPVGCKTQCVLSKPSRGSRSCGCVTEQRQQLHLGLSSSALLSLQAWNQGSYKEMDLEEQHHSHLLIDFLCFLSEGAGTREWLLNWRSTKCNGCKKEWLFLTFEKWQVCLRVWKQGFEWKWSGSDPLCLERELGVRNGLWELFWLYSSIW